MSTHHELFLSLDLEQIKTSQSLLLVLAIFGIVVASSLTATKVKDTRVMVAGIVSLIFSIVMYASPLRAMVSATAQMHVLAF